MSAVNPKQSVAPLPEQLLAADPTLSVWVSASAGTGKTRILVDRMLRLLLRGIQPSRILCITFTKAAAGQIEDRIRHRIMDWTIQSDEIIVDDLKNLLGEMPDAPTLAMAKNLFGRLLNSKRPLAVQTIHSFCQSVLARFPLEAGLLPGFSIASDAQAAQLRQQAFHDALIIATQKPALQQAVQHLFGLTNRDTILTLLTNLQHNQIKWHRQPDHAFGPALHAVFDLPYPYTEIEHQAKFYDTTRTQHATLRALIDHLYSIKNSKTATGFADNLAQFLNDNAQPSLPALQTYLNSATTKDGAITSHLLKLPEKLPTHLSAVLTDELQRIADHGATADKLALLARNHDILLLAQEFVTRYNDLKRQQALLDYNDQIQLTANLLTTADQSSWVMYKLDGGIQHILVDEAQDTSPDQWKIITALTQEMLSGSGQYDAGERSLFVVGDEKQSIYSFQDADIQSYQDTRAWLNAAFKQHGLAWHDIQLTTNFRSSPAILSTVDGIFADQFLKNAITHEDKVTHAAYHATRSGSVTAWPLFVSDNVDTDDDYLPVTIIQERKATQELCAGIAKTIKQWLDEKRFIPRLGRTVQPGDILILLQRRHPLLNPLIKALKDAQIPVAGIDRMVLNEQLIVKDLLALLQTLLQPHDDLTLAALLKSPLIAISEQDLFDLAYKRDGKSLHQCLADSTTIDPAIMAYLNNLCEAYTNGAGPYQILALAINRPCPADSRSGQHALVKRLGFDAQDALDELLNAAMQFEREQTPDIQMFLHWLRHYDADIKRDVGNEQHNHVRLMTVHGAKGLQAPIVFLADASNRPSLFNSQLDLLWADDLPFWSSKPKDDGKLQQAYLEHVKDATDEYYRLLYVALTRAEDELYVTGWQDTRPGERNYLDWHCIANNYLLQHGQPVDTLFGPAQQFAFHGTETKDVVPKRKTKQVPPLTFDDLAWLRLNPPHVDTQAASVLQPSRGPYAEPAVISPLSVPETGRFTRGNVIHKILNYLTRYTADEQAVALDAMLAYPEFDLPERDQKALYREIETLIHQPAKRFIFTKNAHASSELNIAGQVRFENKDYALTGMIDRLVFHDKAWWIIDYKTNRPPATSLEQVPDAYLFQMAAYRALLSVLYPNQTINAVLVWTYTASLMILPAEKLEQLIPIAS